MHTCCHFNCRKSFFLGVGIIQRSVRMTFYFIFLSFKVQSLTFIPKTSQSAVKRENDTNEYTWYADDLYVTFSILVFWTPPVMLVCYVVIQSTQV